MGRWVERVLAPRYVPGSEAVMRRGLMLGLGVFCAQRRGGFDEVSCAQRLSLGGYNVARERAKTYYVRFVFAASL
jgi:hypothetical protein